MRYSLVMTAFFLAIAIVCAHPQPGSAAGAPIPIEQAAVANAAAPTVFTIGSGSYYLSRNIIAKGAKSGITLKANNVTIDFRGYSIIGSGNTSGVGISGGSFSQITIQNGNVVGMGGGGVNVGSNSTVRNMHVNQCGSVGIQSGPSSTIENNTIIGGAGDGISGAGLIRNNVSDGNAGNGITAAANTAVIDNEASGNGGYGIAAQSADGFGSNVLTNNTKGSVSGGVSMGGNVCDGAPCP
jgi:hypothetical protein